MISLFADRRRMLNSDRVRLDHRLSGAAARAAIAPEENGKPAIRAGKSWVTRLDFPLRPQIFDSLSNNFFQIHGGQTIWEHKGFAAELRNLLVEGMKIGTNALVVFEEFTTRQKIFVDFFQAFAQSAAFLGKGLAQMIDIRLYDLFFHRPYLLGNLAFHVLQRLQQPFERFFLSHEILRHLYSGFFHRDIVFRQRL